MKTIIGFDAKRVVRNATGLGSYSRTLVNDLAATGADELLLLLYAPDEGHYELRSQITVRPNVSFHYPTPSSFLPTPFSFLLPPNSFLAKNYWRSRGVVKDLLHDGVQLFHGLSGELPSGLRKAGIRSVVTIHDLIFIRHPEYYHWIDTKLYTWKFRQTVREADHIIAISECTKRDIMELGHVPEKKISVIYQSFSPRFKAPAQSPSNLPPEGGYLQSVFPPGGDKRGAPYLLSVGTIEERKNALLAVKALEYLPDELSLVLVGRSTEYAQQVRRYADHHGLGRRVVMRHDVSDDELPQLYAGAEAFVYPSRYEGFGIPIIEAASMGLPVVAATGSCLEEAGGPDSLYVSPDDPEALAAAVKRVLRGSAEREARIAATRQYICRFRGIDVARQVINVYQLVLQSKVNA